MSLRSRIEDWLSSANCNCSEAVYCTYCEILSDVLEYMDSVEDNGNESEEANHVECDSDDPGCSERPLVDVQQEGRAGADSGASESEASERPAGPKGVSDESKCDALCKFDAAACEHGRWGRPD